MSVGREARAGGPAEAIRRGDATRPGAGRDREPSARVRAVLGPTNTGKTHLAMERLLAHRSGMIGFPLRLLARENYERMVAARGARHVALITGEEKIVPPEARWFSCTVEAMPLDRDVEFLAVDEIQLCADPDRGHVFTDRLLHARGLVETMVMGAETIRPLLTRLVPGIAVETRPRLSALRHAGHAKLSRLPPRSAIVAFSAGEVYAIAEAIRRRRGGCAVVMGRLSPRTRNAQVALYQQGEVDFLVATDAIGMGLNMDVNHVAFAGLSKFDGTTARRLTPSEIGQIAGRAGRGMRDGTFGTAADCPPLADDLVAAVEQHRFDPIETVAWRNAALDFATPAALLRSLLAPPPLPGLARGREASDLETLSVLAADPEIVARARGRQQTRLLWEACQVPDFRKLADDGHARLCARIYTHLSTEGRLPEAWIEQNLSALARPDGDIDTLMQRLSGVRVWAFIAARRDWVGGSARLPDLAREVEETLSDALHERLTARFVDRRAAMLSRRLDDETPDALLSAVTRGGEVIVEGHAVGRVDGFGFTPEFGADGDTRKLMLRAARRALRHEMPRRVGLLAGAEDAAFAIDPAARAVLWEAAPVARLRPGRHLLEPVVDPIGSEFLDGAARERVRARLARFVSGRIRCELAPLFEAREAVRGSAGMRGAVHLLIEAGGVLAHAHVEPPPSPEAKAGLARLGIRDGRFGLYQEAMLKPRAIAMRALLLSVALGRAVPAPASPGRVCLDLPAEPDTVAALERLGFVAAGPAMVRIDVAGRLAAELAHLARSGPAPLPAGIASRLGVRGERVGPILHALGIAIRPVGVLPAGLFGPPAPAMLERARRIARAGARDARHQPAPDNPFARLAGWRASA